MSVSRFNSVRRRLLAQIGTIGLMGSLPKFASGSVGEPIPPLTFESYFSRLIPTQEQIERFVDKKFHEDDRQNNGGFTFDSRLGWLRKKAIRKEGIDGSRCYYNYETTGSRVNLKSPGIGDFRIQSFGDSFTQCSQVNDHETWQNLLASHFMERIENYGVGGYGVYQAFLRYRQIQKQRPGEYIILNIWTDDHYRSLDSWRTVRFGVRRPDGFTQPYLRFNANTMTFDEKPNICSDSRDISRLQDMDFLREHFADDYVTSLVLRNGRAENLQPMDVPVTVGLRVFDVAGGDETAQLNEYRNRALDSTLYVVDKFEQETRKRGQKLMVVLSHDWATVVSALEGEPYWDRRFVDELASRQCPVFDLRDAHIADFMNSSLNPTEYVQQFYIGHFNPRGNQLFAKGLIPALTEWLDPKPKPYI